jgi:soluble cytochrome b562
MNRTGIAKLALALVVAVLSLQGAARADDSPLAERMDIINKNVKKLKKSLPESSQNADSIALATEACKAAAECKTLVPAKIKDLPAEAKAKAQAEYAKMVDELVASFQGMIKALKENKNDEAQKFYEAVMDLKKRGHDKFTE